MLLSRLLSLISAVANRFSNIDPYSFFTSGFLSQTLKIHRTTEEGRGPSLFLSPTSARSRTFRHLFETLHVRLLTCIFNRIACNYQTATRWNLPLYWITIWLIDDGMIISVCFARWFVSRFLLQQLNMGTRWVGTHIEYHPCISSEPTNQVS